MLRYRPPKSNVWGHSLRKMLPSTEWRLFAEFQNRTVEKIARKNYHLSIDKLSRHDPALIITIQEYERLLERPITHSPFEICQDEFERVMGSLVSKEYTLHSLAFRLNLSMRIEICSWSIRGKVSETQAIMDWNYGTSPHISMSLCFNCKDEFYYIQEVLDDLNICKLSEKHLKEIKQIK